MAVEAIVLAQMIITHMIDGRAVAINPSQITHLSEARRDIDEDKQLAPGIHCVIFFADGSYVSSAEECITIADKQNEGKKP